MQRSRAVPSLLLSFAIASSATFAEPLRAQASLAPTSPRGQTVTPVYEGWYRNHDGTYSLSFGYYNRNTAEIVDVPIGPDNNISPGDPNQGQPATFHPRRHWGVFAVVVPADFGTKKILWSLKVRGQSFSIPGSLNPDWQIDALEGEASSTDTPPTLSFTDGGTEGQGPLGVTVGPLQVKVGAPLAITIFAKDDAKTLADAPNGKRVAIPVDVTWFKHRGPGVVTFSPATNRLTPTGGKGSTAATFSAPGDYVIRVRANDSPMTSAGHSQCCWTNGFVKVTVTP
ncbi:MAG: hypothetical protein ABIT38_08480 [Gemmatimonadaceae bacterium]